VPSIVCLPGTIPEGQTCDAMTTGCDWFPTVAELCGADLPDRQYDGKSILPLLKDPSAASPHDHFFWLLGGGRTPQWAVQQGPWKLLQNARDLSDRKKPVKVEPTFLVNLEEDPSEQTNVAAEHPEVVKRLTDIAAGHRRSIELESH